MNILTIIGARPQFIKAAVVSRALREHRPDVSELLVHTGQHFDENMSAVFFRELDIPQPTYNLGIGGGTHGQNTGRMIEAIEEVLLSEQPDWVLVYGDTDSTLAGALAAVKLHIRVAHVEAGLRSFNRRMPEEINRVLTDHACDLLFTPTSTATGNLAVEGISGAKVKQVGDVMYDAALYYGDKAAETSRILESLGLPSKGYILATIHRQENSDDGARMKSILDGFSEAALPVIWPMHPRNRSRLKAFNLRLPITVKRIDPVGYLDMVMLEKNAALIATDYPFLLPPRRPGPVRRRTKRRRDSKNTVTFCKSCLKPYERNLINASPNDNSHNPQHSRSRLRLLGQKPRPQLLQSGPKASRSSKSLTRPRSALITEAAP